MNYSGLYDLIENLEYGTKLHIGVIFFGAKRSVKLLLPYSATIHTNEYCWKIKEFGPDAEKCLRCREMAIRKASYTKKPFAGTCIHGIWEYTHPIFVNDNLLGIIFIGNILDLQKGHNKIMKCLIRRGISADAEHLMNTMEHNIDFQRCESMGLLMESYIRLLLTTDHDADMPFVRNIVVSDILTFIEENLSSDLSVSTIAKIFHYNEKYIGRLFMKVLGCSIRTYICRRRIEHAMLFLRESDDNITDIASKLGFENVTYFNRRFRQITDMTPTEYRHIVKNDDTISSPKIGYAYSTPLPLNL